MLEDEGVEEILGGLFLVGSELADGVELKPQVVVGPALALIEHELVEGHPKREGQALERTHRGLGRAFLVAVDLGLIEADLRCEVFLGEAPGLPEPGQPLGDCREVDPVDGVAPSASIIDRLDRPFVEPSSPR